ncbi:hypothetical protein LLH03_03365 [bacterium]|nr:hypothetical protein [bacterium]
MTEERQAKLDQLAKAKHIEIDNYQSTVQAIFAFAHAALWDPNTDDFVPDSLVAIGPKLKTSKENAVCPSNAVTPDIVVGIGGKWGSVAEVKRTIPRNPDHWGDDLQKQMRKYDDSLSGWPQTQQPLPSHCLTVLVHHTRKVDVVDYLSEHIEAGDLQFERDFAVVAFQRARDLEEQISLERCYGRLTDPELDEELRRVLTIKLDYLITRYQLHFYDSPPPLPYMMAVIWNEVLPSLITVAQYKESREKKRSPHVVVTDDAIARDLQSRLTRCLPPAGQNCRTIPRKQWVRDALEELVRQGHGKKTESGSYDIEYRSFTDAQGRFVRKLADSQLPRDRKPRKTAQPQKQMALFDPDM